MTCTRMRIDSAASWMRVCEEQRWGDGLPVVPPTPELVESFLEASGFPAGERLGCVPPAWGVATVEKVAVNAAMAGCRPDHMPVVIAGVRALLDDRFNLLGVQATTHPCAMFLLVSGPIASAVGITSGHGAFGPASGANGVVGRALRLVALNLGGGMPGVLDMATQGTPAKFAYCTAENDAATPWEPFRVGEGFREDESTVTVAALEAPHNINDHGSTSPEEILRTVAGIAAVPSNQLYLHGTEPFLFLCPEHAATIGDHGWTRQDVQEYLFREARVRPAQLGAGQLERLRRFHETIDSYVELGLDAPELSSMPLAWRPEDFKVVVVGGPAGRHSSWAPSVGAVGRCVTMKVGVG